VADWIDVSRRRVLAFWLPVAVAWFATFAIRPLLEPDEGRYAEIPREMWVTGDWVSPHLNGVLYLEKPPLQYWATAAAYRLFGFHEWTARGWAVALSFLALPLVFAFASRLHGSREAGLAAVAVLAASPYFAILGQINALDGAFSTFLVAAIFALVLGQCEPDARRRRALLVAAWAALALAVLSKGIVAPVLAGGTLALYSLVTRDLSPWRRMHWLPGLAAFAAIVTPWFWLVSSRNPQFLRFFFLHEHFSRFLTTGHRRVEPWWFFVAIVLVALLPWFAALRGALRDARAAAAAATGFRPALFLGLWIACVVVFFSVSSSKLATYVLPFLPAAAAWIGPQLLRQSRLATNAATTTAVLVPLFGVGLYLAALRKAGQFAPPAELVVWSVAAAIVAFAAWLLVRRRSAGGAANGFAPLAVGAILAWQFLLMSYAALPPLRSAKALVEQIRHLVGPVTRVYSVQQYRQSVPPYLGRTVTIAAFRGEFEFGLDPDPAAALPSLEAFADEWRRDSDAIAFLEPRAQAQLAAVGLPGRIVASDGRSIVMARR